MDKKNFFSQIFTSGTVPCALFGMALGLLFAVLCLTIGVGKAALIGLFCLVGAFVGGVKDKAGFIRRIVLFFHRGEN
ncbi:MAG: hypothetical protein IKU38_07270 [Clostridia bacterium]|nr:hypothetical protein [Clostridia bacterium]